MTDKEKYPAQEDQACDENDVLSLLKRIQQHLAFLEKKIDALSTRAPEKPFRENQFQKSRRPFGHARRPHNRGGHEGPPREPRFGPPRHFHPQGENKHRGFSHKKKRFFHRDGNR